MSDVSQGEGWWIASDDKWYPPEQHPDYIPPPPPLPPPPPVVSPPATGSDIWQRDPFGLHQERLFRAGSPTGLVRDNGIGSYDEPPSAAPTAPTLHSPTSSTLLPPAPQGSPASDGNWYPPQPGLPPPPSTQQMPGAIPQSQPWGATAPDAPTEALGSAGGATGTATRPWHRKPVPVVGLALVVVAAVVGILLALSGSSGYPANIQAAYRATCTDDGISSSTCGCLLGWMEANIPLTQAESYN